MTDPLDFKRTVDRAGEKDRQRAGLRAGSHLGEYRIIRLLGRGGMGEVYEAEHEVLNLRYALKLIPDELVSQRGFLERFKREAQVMAHLKHPNIVKVDDFGEIEGKYWLRMELAGGINLEGQKVTTLAELAEAGAGKVEQRLLANILVQVLEGLCYAHGKGAIHRDLKPANILLSGGELSSINVKISDFGLVRLVGEEWVRNRAEQSVSLSMSLGDRITEPGEDKSGTSTRALLGTYEYMSPEQKRGEEVDARSDLYAVGLMAYKLLTGEDLGMKSPTQVDKSLVSEWDELAGNALEQKAANRYLSAVKMLEGLKKLEGSLKQIQQRKWLEETEKIEAEKKRKRREEEKRRREEHLRLEEEKGYEEEKRYPKVKDETGVLKATIRKRTEIPRVEPLTGWVGSLARMKTWKVCALFAISWAILFGVIGRILDMIMRM